MGEILSLRWTDIDPERGFINLRDAKGGARSFPLTAPFIEVLESLPRNGGEWVIPGQRPDSHMKDLAKPWQHVRKAARVGSARLHDLRHSVGAWSASSGDSLLIVGALLGHRQAASTQRYAHLSDHPVRAAAERTAAGIAAALNGDSADVVELRRDR